MTSRMHIPSRRRIGSAALLALALLAMTAGCSSNPKTTEAPTAVATEYAFWPPYPDEPRLQYVVSFKHSGQIAPRKSSALEDIIYGKETNVDAAVNKPYGVEMWNGRIYTCDIRGGAVMVFDLRKKQTRIMGTTGREILVRPTDIAISDDGTKYVADLGRNLIFVFDADERFVRTIGMKDLQPAGLAVFDDRLYVSNFVGQRVEIFDRRNGNHLGSFGEPGDGDGQFVRPLGIEVDAQGNIYVTDVIRCRLQKFSPEGEFLLGFGVITNNIGSFVRPKHIAVDKEGTIYVVDASFQNVQLFSPEGYILTFFGAAGAHPGAMFLPAGITIHYGDMDLFKPYIHPDFEAQYLVLVTNQFGDDKVSVYAFGQLRPGVSVEAIRASQADINLGVEDADKAQGVNPEVTPDDEQPSDLKP